SEQPLGVHGGEQAQWRVVVENVESAAEGADHQIVLAPLELNVAYGDRRKTGPERHPNVAAVGRRIHATLGSDEEQILVDVIFGTRPHRVPLGKIPADARPRAP